MAHSLSKPKQRLMANRNITSTNARHGGGLYTAGCTVTIADSTITRTKAQEDGGAIRIVSGASLSVSNLTLSSNQVGDVSFKVLPEMLVLP